LNHGDLLHRCRRRDRVGDERNEREFENAKHRPVPQTASLTDIVTAKVLSISKDIRRRINVLFVWPHYTLRASCHVRLLVMPVTMSFRSRLAVAFLGAASLMACWPLPEAASLTQSILARLKWPLETRFSTTSLGPTDQITGVIALGGSLARAREAARITSQYPGSKLIVTGASDQEYAAALSYGLEPDRLIREPHARNTFENALFSKHLANPRPGQRWILVTSAIHMPRAMGAFSALDFDVEPWPVFDGDGPVPSVAPAVQHEILGLVFYRALGRTKELFPSPSYPTTWMGHEAVAAQETHALSPSGG
jgi:uncharacterized SAM-binding protein YcdF (DUF218 family)